MELSDALLDSWDRQHQIVMSVASKIDASNRHAKPSEDGWALDHQLAHIHRVRHYWLANFSPEHAKGIGDAFVNVWETPIDDLNEIKGQLEQSGVAVREAVRESLANGAKPSGGYDHPVLFLQHMVWHEGWHVGLILLALRLAGQEPSEEWEDAHIWGQWRTEGG